MEKKYTVYFEIFGKKMKTTVIAKNELDARIQVKDKIIFHKVAESESDPNYFFDVENLKNILGIK